MMVRAYSVDWLLHLHLRVILTTSIRRRGISVPRFLTLKRLSWRLEGCILCMEQEHISSMRYNERLLHEALQGNKGSFKELKFNAGAGDAEAQFYFAQYYAKESDDDFRYWIKKSIINNRYFEKIEEQERQKYIKEEEMTFSEAVRICFSKYATFTGRASRSEYWWFVWFFFLVILFFAFITILFVREEWSFYLVSALSLLCTLAIVVPGVAVGVRRLHDIGKSGWWLLISFIPYIGAFYLLYLSCKKSAPDNEYGKTPEK